MIQPPGMEDSQHPKYVCKLNKALYGLKQAPWAWFQKLSMSLFNLGFLSSKSDQSLFIHHASSSTTLLIFYVDDILIAGSDSTFVQHIISELNKCFALKDLGLLNYFLGIQVTSTSDGIFLTQTKYIFDLLNKLNMLSTNSLPTPMVSSDKLTYTGTDPIQDVHQYRSVVGALQYITITRLELSYSVNMVCQYMQTPLESHWKAVKWILRYLKGTISHGLHLQRSSHLALTGFSVADWASDSEDRRSTSGCCAFLSANLVSRSSKKQSTVSRSSTEA